MTQNFDAFNQVVGLLFDQLYREFPIACEVDYRELASKIGSEVLPYVPPEWLITVRTETYGDILPGIELESFVNNAIEFLEVEGFIQRQDRHRIRLSAKALAILNAPLPGLQMAVGDKIVEISKDVGSSAGRAAMSEVIGHLLGAAARGLLG